MSGEIDKRKGLRRGRCFKLGHDVPLDNAIMPVRYAVTHEFSPAVLVPHLFEGTIDKFSELAKPGDIVVAGRAFCSGKAHAQGLIAMAAVGLSILCESMPFQAYRGAVSQGILCNRNCEGVLSVVEDGDEIEVDYATGRFRNHTRKLERTFPPIEAQLLALMATGGTKAMLKQWNENRGIGSTQ